MDELINKMRECEWYGVENIIKREKNIDWTYTIDSVNNLLHYLSYHRKTDLIKLIDFEILKKIILIANFEGETILHIAAKTMNPSLIEYSLKTNLDLIYMKNLLECTPLFYLIKNINILKKILSDYIFNDHKITANSNLIDIYIMKQDIDMIIFICNHIRINEVTQISTFNIICSYFSEDDKIKLLTILINKNLDINYSKAYSRSYLIVSLEQKYIKVAKFLIENNADINYSGSFNDLNPLKIAIIHSYVEIIDILIKIPELDYNIIDQLLRTPAFYIFVNRSTIDIEQKKYILSKTLDLHAEDVNLVTIADYILDNENNNELKSFIKKKKTKENKIKIFEYPIATYTNFIGDLSFFTFYLYTILIKYPNMKIPLVTNQVNFDELSKKMKQHSNPNISFFFEEFMISRIFINSYIIWSSNGDNYVSDDLIDGIKETEKKYNKTMIIVIKLSIISKNSTHSNIILIDVNRKIIERFDPYGPVDPSQVPQLDIFLESLFSKLSDYTYKCPKKIINQIIFQSIEDDNDNNITDPKGFCSSWCFWYLETRYINYDYDPKKVILGSIKKINQLGTFKQYIRNYSNSIEKEKNKIFTKLEFPKEYWYAFRIPSNYLEKINFGIIKMYEEIVF